MRLTPVSKKVLPKGRDYLLVVVAAILGHACSTTRVEPMPALPEGPSYLSVPHPGGFDLNEARLLFRGAQAPKPEALKDCDAEFLKIKSVITLPDDFDKGVSEAVRQNPEGYHWCFYSKIIEMYDAIQAKESALRDRQQVVLKAYEFLSPVAKAFRTEFSDTRYQRYAVARYRELSPWVFYRQVELTPQATSDLMVGVGQPFGALVPRADDAQLGAPQQTVLERYGIKSQQPTGFAPPEFVPGSPASTAAAAPTPTAPAALPHRYRPTLAPDPTFKREPASAIEPATQ